MIVAGAFANAMGCERGCGPKRRMPCHSVLAIRIQADRRQKQVPFVAVKSLLTNMSGKGYCTGHPIQAAGLDSLFEPSRVDTQSGGQELSVSSTTLIPGTALQKCWLTYDKFPRAGVKLYAGNRGNPQASNV